MAESTDIIMKFELAGKTPVWCESTARVDTRDPLTKDFKSVTDINDYCNFFEVESFNFGLALSEADQSKSALSKNPGGPGSAPATPAAAGQPAAKAPLPFSRWRSLTDQQAFNFRYPVQFNSFSFKRLVDSASPVFFTACLNTQTFESVTLVKRLSTGKGRANETDMQAYLRIDFYNAIITSISWDDGDLVDESCTFRCDRMIIQYQQFADSGSLVPGGSASAEWPTKDNSRIAHGIAIIRGRNG